MISPNIPNPLSSASQVSPENIYSSNDLSEINLFRNLIYERTGSFLESDRIINDLTSTKEDKMTRIFNLYQEVTKKIEKNENLWESFKKGKHDEILDQFGWKKLIATKGNPVVIDKSPETQFFETLVHDLIEFHEQYTFILEENKIFVQKNNNFVLLPTSNEKVELGSLLKKVDLTYVALTPKLLDIFNQKIIVQSEYSKNEESYRPPAYGDVLTYAERQVIYKYTSSNLFIFANHILAGRFQDLKQAEPAQFSDVNKVVKETLMQSVLLNSALKKIRYEGESVTFRMDSQLPEDIIRARIQAVEQKSLVKELAFISASIGGTSPQHPSGKVATILLTSTAGNVSSLSGMSNENEMLTPPGHIQYLAYQKLDLTHGQTKYIFFARALSTRPVEWTDRLLNFFSFNKNP